MQEILEFRKIPVRKILSVAAPILFGSAVQTGILITDTAFLGHLGKLPLAASAIAGLLYFVFAMLFWGFSTGLQILIARRNGEQHYREIGSLVSHAQVMMWSLAIFLFIVLMLSLRSMLAFMVKDPDVALQAYDYLQVRIFGYFFCSLNFSFRGFYVGIGRTRVITFVTFSMLVVNIFLDYVLIFGKLGFPEMAMRGAALASVIAELVGLLVFLFFTLQKIDWRRYWFFTYGAFRRRIAKDLLRTGAPLLIQSSVNFFSWFVFFLIIEKMGVLELAVSNLLRSVLVTYFIPINGFCAATSTFVGFLYGSKHNERIIPFVKRALWLTSLSILLVVIPVLLFPNAILGIFSDEQEIIAAAIPIVYLISLSIFGQGIGNILFYAVMGLGRTLQAFYIDMFVLVVYIFSVWLFALGLHGTLFEVWCADFVYAGLLIVLLLLYIRHLRAKNLVPNLIGRSPAQ